MGNKAIGLVLVAKKLKRDGRDDRSQWVLPAD
jgi:hypothetical protein